MKNHKELVYEWALATGVTTSPKVWGLLQRAGYAEGTPQSSSLSQLRAALDTYSLGSRSSVAAAFNAYAGWLRKQGYAIPDFKSGDIPLPVAAIATLYSALRNSVQGFSLDALRHVQRADLDLGYPGAYRGIALACGLSEDTWARTCRELLAWSMNSPLLLPAEPGGGYAIAEARLRDALVRYRDSQKAA
jgi:hypothetical protein